MAGMTAAQQQQQARQINMQARHMVLSQAIPRRQQIANISVSSAGTITSTNNVVNIVPQSVGLTRKFIVEVSATLTNTGSTNAITPTNFGMANFFQQVLFNDLQNNTRIQTSGWHLAMINSFRKKRINGTTMALSAPASEPKIVSMGTWGNSWGNIISAPSTLADSSTTSSIYGIYEIPLAYSDDDLRGAIYLNTVNASALLQLTINPNPFIVQTSDPTLAMYTGAAGSATLSAVNITVYQDYLDQLPIGNGGPVLPPMDVSTIYGLYNTSLTGLSTTQDFPIPFANFRDFLSACCVYDNWNTSSHGYPTPGSDINYWNLQSANFTNIWKNDPYLAAYLVRQMMGDDCPVPLYYFDFRRKPVSTVQTGNMQINLNPSTVNTAAQVLVGWEYFSMVNTITGSASLPAS
jgi:P3 major capsid protein